MRKVTYSMGMSLDGFIEGPDGVFQWNVPSQELFRFSIEEITTVGVHLLGTRLYQTMLYWLDPDIAAGFDDAEREWADLWNPLPKVVFSHSLTDLDPSARLASSSLAEEVARLREEPGEGDIAIGGADLAAQAAALDLIDEYQVRVFPVLVGGGKPMFALDGLQRNLELVETRTFDGGVVQLRYRAKRYQRRRPELH